MPQAAPAQPQVTDYEPKTTRLSKAAATELLLKAKKAYRLDVEADEHNRLKCIDDLRFLHLPGSQWDQDIKERRGKRPCYEFNKVRITVKRVVNDMRANRPSGKVRGTEDGDKKTADIYEGLIRNIWNVSDGDTAIDHAAEFQVGGGIGAWRVSTEWSDDEAWSQDICIEPIKNPLCLYWDCAAQEPLKRDARHWFLTSMIAKEVYETTYPNKQVVSFEEVVVGDQSEQINDWVQESMVRICEYWYKEPVTKQLALLQDGNTVDLKVTQVDPSMIVKQREVKTSKIMMCIMGGGDAILADPVEWVGDEFPFIVVFGEEIALDGRNHWFGLTRFAKDAQRGYNVSRTNLIESAALTPQAKLWMTPAQVQGLGDVFAEGHEKNYPYYLYNPDPKAPGPPQRMASADIPMSLVTEIQMASEDIKAVTGIFDNSLGKQANEVSGTAIKARQSQGEIATFNYMDNLSKGIRRTWEILVNIIPKVYDTPRSIRILGKDGADSYEQINATGPDGKVENDLARGKYDVTITTGPAFSTMRQEAAETYGQLMQASPEVMSVAADLVFKAMDLPYSEEIAERLKVMLPPPIQQMLQQGKQVDPEVAQQMAQVNQAMQQVQQHGQLVQQAADEAKKEQQDARQAKTDAQAASAQIKIQQAQLDAQSQVAIANLKVQEANLATDVANFKALVAQTQAAMGDTEDAAVVKADREFLSNQITASLTDIQENTTKFKEDALKMISDFHAKAQPPKLKQMVSKRVNGELIHTPVYDDGTGSPAANAG